MLSGLVILISMQGQAAETVNLSGDWEIHSSVGGATPITVNCSLKHVDAVLSGSCTPVMDNAQPSQLDGHTDGTTGQWGYDVVFNANPGRVDFSADSLSQDLMTGTLSLSGTEAPFEAQRR